MMLPQGDAPVTFLQHHHLERTCTARPAPPGLRSTRAAMRRPTRSAVPPNAQLDAAQVKLDSGPRPFADKEFYYGTPLAFALTGAIAAQRKSTLPGARRSSSSPTETPADCNNAADFTADDPQRVVDAAVAGFGQHASRANVRHGRRRRNEGRHAREPPRSQKAGATGRTANCENTNDCHYALNASTFTSDIKKAFDQISLQAFDCTFNPFPQTANNDPNNVNAEPHDDGGSQGVNRDPNHQNGWDYLLNAGTQIQLYGQVRTDMKNDAAAKVDTSSAARRSRSSASTK